MSSFIFRSNNNRSWPGMKSLAWFAACLWIVLNAQSVFAQRDNGDGTIYFPIVFDLHSTDDRQLQPEVVFGVQGRLDRVTLTEYQQTLTMPNGNEVALQGRSAVLQAALDSLSRRVPRPTVKVWGTLYPPGKLIAIPYIVVTDLMEVVSAATGPAPTATGKFDVVNLRAGPRDDFPITGKVYRGQACSVVGRNTVSTWLHIVCPGGGVGWINALLVAVVGNLGNAQVESDAQVSAPPTPTSAPTPRVQPTPTATPIIYRNWKAQYFTNAQFAGTPFIIVDEPQIDFDWGEKSPRSNMPADFYSIRFERTVNFASGVYAFVVDVQGSLRIYVDDSLLIQQSSITVGQSYRAVVALSGAHSVRVDYADTAGNARVKVRWELPTQPLRWRAQYYPTINFVGTATVLEQEPSGSPYQLDYSWGGGSPLAQSLDEWSARWEGSFQFDAGNYMFAASADDGVRVFIDGQKLLDKWTDGKGEIRNRFMGIGEGEHTISVTYYEHSGTAHVRVWWYRESGPGAGPQ